MALCVTFSEGGLWEREETKSTTILFKTMLFSLFLGKMET